MSDAIEILPNDIPEDFIYDEPEPTPEQLAWEDAEKTRYYYEWLEQQAQDGQDACDAITLKENGELAVLFAQFKKWLAIEDIDLDVIRFVLAIYFSHSFGVSDPIWGIIVGPSGGGKSELLKTLLEDALCYHLSNVTPNTLASGFRKKKGDSDEDVSLLKQMNGKILLIPDLAPILSQKPENRKQIMAMFRESYDGIVMSGKGNTGRTEYSSKFSFLTASTYVIDTLGSEINEFGERFIRIRMRGNNGRAKGRQAAQNATRGLQMRDELKQAVADFIQSRRKGKAGTSISDEHKNAVADIAYLTARARTAVTRDRFRRDVEFTPVAEDPGRLTIQLIKLLGAVAIVNGHEKVQESDLEFIRRVADDCLPPDRLKVLNALRSAEKGRYMTVAEVSQAGSSSWVPRTTTERILEDLELLDVVERDISTPNSKSYRLKVLSVIEL